jgi:hypothetical protein
MNFLIDQPVVSSIQRETARAANTIVRCASIEFALLRIMRSMPLPNGALYPLRTLLAAGAVYGVATVAHGSGFLAVFVAGILIGDTRAPTRGRSSVSTPRRAVPDHGGAGRWRR